MGRARVLVTGSCGLIGSEVCLHFHQAGYSVLGLDNNQRAVFFGPEGDTSWSLLRLLAKSPDTSITPSTSATAKACFPGRESSGRRVIVHTAAQPSHDRAADIPFDDFEVNAVGTLNCSKPRAARVRSRRSSICRPIRSTATGPTPLR